MNQENSISKQPENQRVRDNLELWLIDENTKALFEVLRYKKDLADDLLLTVARDVKNPMQDRYLAEIGGTLNVLEDLLNIEVFMEELMICLTKSDQERKAEE